jgi:DNA-binding GntR family transcriptional regulator
VGVGEASVTADTVQAGEPGPIRPVERPVPLRQSVYEALVELVVAGRLRPSQHLVETELARQLGVSRQPVREALHRLEAEGWVDLRPNQGAFVHVPTDEEVDQLLDVRELLEVETVRLAAMAATNGCLLYKYPSPRD